MIDHIGITREIENMLIDWMDVVVYPISDNELEVEVRDTLRTYTILVEPNE
jgi:hypothetical protein